MTPGLHRTPLTALLVPVLVALALLTGCTGGTGDAPTDDGAVLTEPGPAPPPGPTGEPTVGITSLAPVAPGEPARFSDAGLTATVVQIAPVDVEARLPGEIAGPGASVTLELQNGSDQPIDLAGVAVNAYLADMVPAAVNDGPPAAPAAGTLAAGGSATGVYVFQVPDADAADGLVVEINYSGSAEIAYVQG